MLKKVSLFCSVIFLALGFTLPAASQEGGVITFWHAVQGNEREMVDDAIARFEADHPGFTVEPSFYEPDSYKTQIRIALGANNAPCVFFSWGGGIMNSYVDAGQIIELAPKMEADGWIDRLVPSSLTHVTYNDAIWGVPVMNTSPAIFFYNKEIFEQYGLQPPTTYDEFLSIIDTLKGNGIAPISLANFSKWPSSFYYMYLVDRLGGPEVFASAANRTGSTFEDPIFIRAGEMIQELVERGAFADGYNGIDYATGGDRMLLYANVAAMELMGNWHMSLVAAEDPDYFEKMGVFPFPAVTDGAGNPSNVVGSVGQNFFHVSSACEHPDEAFSLIQYMVDDVAVTTSVEEGRIPPIVGVGEMLSDPLAQQIFGIVEDAESIQLWYDQYLPPELAEVHLDLVQELFALTISPEEAASRMEAAAKTYFGEE